MARIKKIQAQKPGDWQTVFCSLAIILVAFFVMLSSYSTLEKGKIIEVQRSFKGSLQIFPGGILFDKGEGIIVPSPDMGGYKVEKVAAPIVQLLKGKGLEEKIKLKSSDDYVSLAILDSLLFDKGSVEISPDTKKILEQIAQILGEFDLPVRVEGHTGDDRVVRNGEEYHWQLSALRAAAVMTVIQKEGNIAGDKITSVGFGPYRPFVTDRSDKARRMNRRVEIIIPIVENFFDKKDALLRKAPPSFKVWDLSE